jgi:micrococcal nuclease
MIVRFDKVIAEMIGKAPKSMLVALIILAVAASYELGFQVKQDLLGVEGEATTQTEKKYYKVTRVVDGDTLHVDVDGTDETVRLIGINTPETVDPRRTVECFGKEASTRMKEIASGKYVYLESDETQDTRDSYGRMLAYVYLEDGQMLNRKMIAEGYAYEYTYFTPYKYQKEFRGLQNFAQASKYGLWADTTCRGKK